MNTKTSSTLKLSLAVGFMATAWTAPAAAASPMETAFAAWKTKYGITSSSLVINNAGTITADAGADTPVRIASSSKSITAVCVGTLVRDGRLGFTWPLAAVIPQYFRTYGYGFFFGPPWLQQAQLAKRLNMPVTSLLVHQSGILHDTTQSWSNNFAIQNDGAMLVGAFNVQTVEQGNFIYNNVNYTTLAMAIAERTGETYENYCKRAVMTPAGITTARLSPTVRLFSGAGGWEISPRDYMKFMTRYVGSRATNPVLPLAAWPGISGLQPGQVAYGPGAWVRAYSVVRTTVKTFNGIQIVVPTVVTEYNLWHSGALSLPGTLGSFGSYFVTYGDLNKSWFATFSPRPSDAAYQELDQVMGVAAPK